MFSYDHPIKRSDVPFYYDSDTRKNTGLQVTEDINKFNVWNNGGWFWKEVQMWPVPITRPFYRNQHRLNVLIHLHLYKYYLSGRIKDVSKKYCKTGIKANMCRMPLKLRRFLMHHVRRLEELYMGFVSKNAVRAQDHGNVDMKTMAKEIGCVLNGDFTMMGVDGGVKCDNLTDEDYEKKSICMTFKRPKAHRYFMTFFQRFYAKTKSNMYTSRFDLCKEFVLQNEELICLPRLIKNLSTIEDTAMAIALTTKDIQEAVVDFVDPGFQGGGVNNNVQVSTNVNSGVVNNVMAMQQGKKEGPAGIQSIRVADWMKVSKEEREGVQVLAMDSERIDVCSPNGWVDFVPCASILNTIVNKFNIIGVKTEWQMALKKGFVDFAREIDEHFEAYDIQANYQVRRFEDGMRSTIQALDTFTYQQCEDDMNDSDCKFYKHELTKHITTRPVDSELVDIVGAGWEAVMAGQPVDPHAICLLSRVARSNAVGPLLSSHYHVICEGKMNIMDLLPKTDDKDFESLTKMFSDFKKQMNGVFITNKVTKRMAEVISVDGKSVVHEKSENDEKEKETQVLVSELVTQRGIVWDATQKLNQKTVEVVYDDNSEMDKFKFEKENWDVISVSESDIAKNKRCLGVIEQEIQNLAKQQLETNWNLAWVNMGNALNMINPVAYTSNQQERKSSYWGENKMPLVRRFDALRARIEERYNYENIIKTKWTLGRSLSLTAKRKGAIAVGNDKEVLHFHSKVIEDMITCYRKRFAGAVSGWEEMQNSSFERVKKETEVICKW